MPEINARSAVPKPTYVEVQQEGVTTTEFMDTELIASSLLIVQQPVEEPMSMLPVPIFVSVAKPVEQEHEISHSEPEPFAFGVKPKYLRSRIS